MVHYKSDIGTFDAPVDKVWKLIEAHTDENASKIHPGFVSVKTIEAKGTVATKEFRIRGPDGKEWTERLRITANPPKSSVLEWLTGPMAGSKATNTYTPRGEKTEVVSEGEFKIDGLDDKTTLEQVRQFMDHAFDEDQTYLKAMK